MYTVNSIHKFIILSIVTILLSSCGGGSSGGLPDVPPPTKPDESKISAVSGDGAVTINWQAEPNLTYNIYRSLDRGNTIEAAIVTAQSGSSFVDSTASNDIEYTYFITSVELGKESDKSKSPPVTPYARVLKITSGEHTCIIKNDGDIAGYGSLWCWGDNAQGELGIGTQTYSEEPQQVLLGEANSDKVKNDWKQVSAGSVHTCAIKGINENLYCWGFNNNNQLGIGSIARSLIPVQVGVAQNLQQGWSGIDVGVSHSCGMRGDGKSSNRVYCWGSNLAGQIGNGLVGTNQIVPIEIGNSLNWKEITVGKFHSCGIQVAPGTLKSSAWCWGRRFNGQIGDGLDLGEATIPTEVILPNPTEANLTGWTSITAGKKNTCAIRTVGTGANTSDSLWCWGDNNYGQLGINDTAIKSTSTPKQEASLAVNWLDVKSYSDTVCGQRKTKEIFCWGSNDTGQVGNGTASDTPVLENVAAIISDGVVYKDWLLFDVGENHSCGLKPDNKLYCWGTRSRTTLGKSNADVSKPTRVNSEINWASIAIAAQGEFNIALKKDNTIQSWGRNFDGQLGTVDGQYKNEKQPTNLASLLTWKKISVGSKSVFSRDFSTNALSCAISAIDDTLWCWGNNTFIIPASTIPVQVNRVDKWQGIAVGTYHVCGIKLDKSLWCIGNNGRGELGNKSTISSSKFVAVATPAAVTGGWSSVVTGHLYSCAISAIEQSLYCWGYNGSGQLGDGSVSDNLIPTLVSNDTSANAVNTWSKVVVGSSHTCGIKTNGDLSCWGYNKYGQLGRDNIANANIIPQVVNLANSKWIDIDVGRLYSCGIRAVLSVTEGELYCWGRNESGKLGLGAFTSSDSANPILAKVGTDATWSVVAAGKFHSCAIKYDAELAGDSLWCWGLNKYGELGTNNAWAANPVYLSIP